MQSNSISNDFRSRDLGPDVGKPSLKLGSLGMRRLHLNFPLNGRRVVGRPLEWDERRGQKPRQALERSRGFKTWDDHRQE